jgi:hypothetical protein
VEVVCFSCKAKTAFSDKLGFRAECNCGEDLHVCKNCDFYDAKVYNECRESSADVIREKGRANYCEYFRARTSQDKEADKKAMLAAAEALFKKSGDK